jgi:AbrB family looped-hinge helix DNA binding protein
MLNCQKNHGKVMVTTIDKFGRIIIPKKFRERIGISSETTLNISEDGKKIIIEPVEDNNPVVEEDGILVFTGKLEDKEKDLLRGDRNKRIRKLLINDD